MRGEQPAASVVTRHPRTARGVAAAVLSSLIPGLGQLAVGARRRGALLLATSLVVVLIGREARHATAAVVELLMRPGGLALVVAVNLVLVGFRVFATLDAFRIGAGDVTRRASEQGATPGTFAAVTVLVAAVLVPHAVAVHYAMITKDTLHDVFAGDLEGGEGDRSPDITRPASDDGTADADDPPSSQELGRSDHGAPWLDQDRLTVAVFGSDAHPSRDGHRIDAMMVVSVQLETADVTIMSVERHLRGFPLPSHLADLWERHCRDFGPGWELLNAVYRCADEVIAAEVAELYPRAPDPAAAVLADVLGELLDVLVDHYVMVDMAGFKEIVDALGGVRIDVDGRPDIDQGRPVEGCDWHDFDVRASTRHLDGAAALQLARERDGTTEADRMGRQRCLLVALARQADPVTLLRRFERVAGVFRQHLTSSIPLRDLPAVIELVQHLDHDRIETIGFHRPEHVAADATPRLELIRQRVDEALGERSSRPLATPRVTG